MSECQVPRCGSSSAARGHGVCDDCWSRRGRVLADMLALWQELHQHLHPAQRGLSEAISRQPAGSRLPLNGAVLDAMQSVPTTLLGWANTCRRLRSQPELSSEGKRWGFLIQEALTTLDAIDGELHYGPYAVDYLAAVFSMHGRMISLAGLAQLVHRLHAACPECDRRELVRHNGEDRVRCAYCASIWSRPEYDRMVVVQARSRRRA
jgi:hypothetical protein